MTLYTSKILFEDENDSYLKRVIKDYVARSLQGMMFVELLGTIIIV